MEPIFHVLLDLAEGKPVNTGVQRRDGSNIWIRPSVSDVISAQRLLYDRTMGKPAQAIAVQSQPAPSPGQAAAVELTPEERSKLAELWRDVLRRRAAATLDAAAVPPPGGKENAKAPGDP